MKDVEIYRDKGEVDIKIIEEYEKLIGYKFPKKYKSLLSKHNGLYPERESFLYYNEVLKTEDGNGIYFYFFKENNQYELGDSSSSMVYFFLEDEDMPNHLVPFGGTGNGDIICFDYREDIKSDNPKIVLLHHDAAYDDGSLIISFLSNSFEEFMDSLYKYQDDEDDDFEWNDEN